MKKLIDKIPYKVVNIGLYILFFSVCLIILNIYISENKLVNLNFFSLDLRYLIVSLIGDFSFLLIFLSFIILFKNRIYKVILMNIIIIFLIGYVFFQFSFTKYYNNVYPYFHFKTEFSDPFLNKIIFKGMVSDFFEFGYYISFIYLVVFNLYALLYLKKKTNKINAIFYNHKLSNIIGINNNIKLFFSPLLFLLIFGISLGISYSTFNIYKSFLKNKWRLESSDSNLLMQITGKINYLFYVDYDPFVSEKININEKDEIIKYSKSNLYSKNILGNNKEKEIKIKDIPNLNKNVLPKGFDLESNLNSKFKDYNLVFVQMESFHHLLLGKENNSILNRDDILPNMKKLINESYLIDNLYHSVGVGHSSDGIHSVLLGLYPTGNRINSYVFADNKYNYSYSLPKLLSKNNYNTYFLEGSNLDFYNYFYTTRNLYGYENIYYYTNEKRYIDNTNNLYKNIDKYIPSFYDKDILINAITTKNNVDMLNDKALPTISYNLIKEDINKKFLHVTLLSPHAPFNYFEKKLNLNENIKYKMSSEGRNYLDSVIELDETILEFIKFANKMENTVFVFYSDHAPNGIYKNDIEAILNRKISEVEYLKEKNHIVSFIYIPDYDKTKDNISEPKGILKGVQNLVRSELDIYSTVLELFFDEKDINFNYFGANLFSNEKSYALDPKNMFLVTDDYSILGTSLYGRYSQIAYENKSSKDLKEIIEIYNEIKKFKICVNKYILNGKLNELVEE